MKNASFTKKIGIRLTAALIATMLCLGVLSSCNTAGGIAGGSSTPAGSLILGEMLNLTSVNNDAANELVNNSGMSGLEANNHLHGISTADMYIATLGETIIFSIERMSSIGQLYIWNYSETGKTNCGIKDVNIQYSADGATWVDAGSITLPEASQSEIDTYGGCVAANYDSPFNFGGVAAKYIALTPSSNHGGEATGLAEIRLFRHKIRPGKGDMITGEAVVANVGITPEAAVNNQGMSDLTSATATHNNVTSDMWLSTESLDKSYFVMHLDGSYPVSKITLWNYNDASNLGNGIKDFEIYYTVEIPCHIEEETNNEGKVTKQTFDFSQGKWTKLEIDGNSTFTMSKGDGSEALAPSFTLNLKEVIHAQHIKIVPLSNYGGNGYGLSEMRVFAGSGWGIEPSRSWTGLLSTSGSFDYQGSAYNRNGGWIGADGIHTYNMNGNQQPGGTDKNSVIFMLFQDTVVGNMNNYKFFNSRSGYKASHSGWVNMSYLVVKGNEPDVRNAQFILQGKDSANHPYNNIAAKHYWIGDFTVINGIAYADACMYEGWDTPQGTQGNDSLMIFFNEDGTPDMTRVPEVAADLIPGYAQGKLFENTKEAGAPNPDGYIYTFSSKSSRFVVSRCLPENYTKYDKWEFWTGSEWSTDSSRLNVLKAKITNYSIGNESGVSYCPAGAFAGKYVNIYTEGSVQGQVKIGVADSLTGRYEDGGSLFWATEKYEYTLERGYDGVRQWNYNAKSQPALSKAGEMLISYHIGTQNGLNNTMALEYVHPVFYNMFQVD